MHNNRYGANGKKQNTIKVQFKQKNFPKTIDNRFMRMYNYARSNDY